MPLEDKTVMETETAQMTCEISCPNAKVRWYKEGVELKSNDHYKISVSGKVHKLLVKETILEDEAEIAATVMNDKTSATLWVEGKEADL